MTTPVNGSVFTPPELLMYWIRERYRILMLKSEGKPAPWSQDPVFQTTYFCNVRREDDKVTKWVREFYSPHVDHPMFEYNMVLARFLNRPETLKRLGYQDVYVPDTLEYLLSQMDKAGEKIWGSAYVITTHGIKMPKLQYLCRNVLPAAYVAIERHRAVLRGPRCGAAATALEEIEGVGSFLSAQVVADLKNTSGHPLKDAYDWTSFVQPGPGSIRGASWFHYNEPGKVTSTNFMEHFIEIRRYVDNHWDFSVPPICNQDLQNCLCEFDKYMRVRSGTGRSKRKYNGSR